MRSTRIIIHESHPNWSAKKSRSCDADNYFWKFERDSGKDVQLDRTNAIFRSTARRDAREFGSFVVGVSPIRLAVEQWIGFVAILKVKGEQDSPDSRSPTPRQRAAETDSAQGSRKAKQDKLPPNSVDAEKGVLGSILISKGELVPEVQAALPTTHYFYNPTHAKIYQCLIDQWDSGEKLDLITFTQFLRDHRLLDQVGGAGFVTELFTFVPTAANVSFYIDIVKEKFLRREMIAAGTSMVRKAYDEDSETDDIFTDASKRIDQIKRAAGSPNGAEQFVIDDLMNFDPAHDPLCLVGNRWQCRGSSSLWCGGAGYGKSSLVVQAAIYWGTGNRLFGIKPVRALKSLIVQAENDMGDTGEQLQGVMAGISALGDIDVAATRQTIVENVKIYRVIGYAGGKFLDLLSKLIELEKPDLVWIDPLFAFAGCDLLDAERTGAFLREGLFPLIVRAGVATQVVHHVGKPVRDKDDRPMSDIDLQYLGFGTSEIQNAFRAVNILLPLRKHPGVFSLTLSKRGERARAKTPDGQITRTIFMEHSREGICWMQCEKPETQKGREAQYSEKDILEEMSVAVGMKTSDLQKHMQTECGMSRATFFRVFNELKKTGKIRVNQEGEWTKKLSPA